MTDDTDADELLRRLDVVEAGLDPGPLRRGRLTADLATVAFLAPIAIYLDWHATRPFLLLGLMLAGVGLNRLIPFLTRRSLLQERDRITGAAGRLAGEQDSTRSPTADSRLEQRDG